jgi:hypothetical protein|tara:strand:+ start:336 stop:587 length:252 start_codon:yes stop_codon:yes gene_type:complete
MSEILGLGESSIYDSIRSGEIAVVPIAAKKNRIPRREVLRLLGEDSLDRYDEGFGDGWKACTDALADELAARRNRPDRQEAAG